MATEKPYLLSIYDLGDVAELLEDDAIEGWEEAFMYGYIQEKPDQKSP